MNYSELVDKVAEAIREAHVATGAAGPRPAWMNVPEERREKWRVMARAAIEVLGPPGNGMEESIAELTARDVEPPF